MLRRLLADADVLVENYRHLVDGPSPEFIMFAVDVAFARQVAAA